MAADYKAEFENAVATAATMLALRVRIDGREHWIPQSVIDEDSEVYRVGDTGKLVVAEWWAIKEGLV
jgi:hypothetical protein